MTLQRWFLLIGLCVACGLGQVTWRHTLLAKQYDVGGRMKQLERRQTELAWLTSEVVGLESPVRLAQIAQARNLQLTAWRPWSTAALVQVAADYGVTSP